MSEGTVEGIALILGVLFWVVFAVLVGIAALYSLAILLGDRWGRRRETDTPPRATADHAWSVRLPDGNHRFEVRGDLDRPLVAYCDGVGTPLDWHGSYDPVGGYATFVISGREGRL